jgi:hypothetical protein
MQRLLKTTWFAGLAGLMAMATACGDDTGAGGAGGGSGGGGGGTPSSSSSGSGTPTSSSSGQGTTNSSSGQGTPTSSSSGDGGATGQGGDGGATGQGGDGGATGQGGDGGATGQGGDGGATGQGGDGGAGDGGAGGGTGGGEEGTFTLDSGVIDVDIPDADAEGVTIELPPQATGTVATVESLTITLEHSFAGDLFLVLEAPEEGDFFTIFLDEPETPANFSFTFPITFDPDSDVGASEIGADLEDGDTIGEDGVTSFFPEPESFDALAGADVNGTWRVYAVDSFGGDVGAITRVVVNGTLE